ncbi:NUDIX domain-containing protein [Shinella zoogloeoides]|uniref:NUDIX domain-containing protein n=1 Tax=Shinella zoogloeoides TaxID=352475 RepID=UPI00273FDEE0|nr:NUDIX domain-containing protein [Shinella zoogloeoides]WLR90922.1 NUDIX domain-containing protein [Shinella zoogloeoides]
MQPNYQYGVYIGRFQPLHIGHEHVIREALSKVETLIVVVGSAYQARTPVNPFTYDERRAMIEAVFKHEISTGRMIVMPLMDYDPDTRWAHHLRNDVHGIVLDRLNKGGIRLHGLKDTTIALAGYGKDASSYYLNMFPEWGSIQLTTQHGTINASDIRWDYLRSLPRMPHDAVSGSILAWLKEFSLTEAFKDLIAYKKALQEGREFYGTGPFLAADALVSHRGKILLVTRGKAVGKGTLAMPGGFLNDGEPFFYAACRELKEETGLEMAELEKYLVGHQVADKPDRSLRGRIVSVVYHFELPDSIEIPTVEGRDDAAHAGWYSFADLRPEQFFEDHYTLISNAF